MKPFARDAPTDAGIVVAWVAAQDTVETGVGRFQRASFVKHEADKILFGKRRKAQTHNADAAAQRETRGGYEPMDFKQDGNHDDRACTDYNGDPTTDRIRPPGYAAQ